MQDKHNFTQIPGDRKCLPATVNMGHFQINMMDLIRPKRWSNIYPFIDECQVMRTDVEGYDEFTIHVQATICGSITHYLVEGGPLLPLFRKAEPV